MCCFEAGVVFMPSLRWTQLKVTVHTWARMEGRVINNKSEFFDIFFVILFYFEGVVHLFFLLPFFCSHSAVQLFPPFLYSNKGL